MQALLALTRSSFETLSIHDLVADRNLWQGILGLGWGSKADLQRKPLYPHLELFLLTQELLRCRQVRILRHYF